VFSPKPIVVTTMASNETVLVENALTNVLIPMVINFK